MRILHFISAAAAGGAEVYVKDLAKALVARGHEVHIGFLSSANRVNRSKSFEDAFLKELEVAGIKYFFAGDDARKKPWQGIAKVRSYIKQNNIDVYHSHLFYGVVFGGFSRLPRIYTHHINVPRYNKFNWKVINLLVDEIVGISHICHQNIKSVIRSNSRVIMNGVNIEKFLPFRRERKREELVRFLSVGSITVQKNYELLIETVATLPIIIRDQCQFSIAGEGESEYSDSLKKLAIDRGVEKHITFMGNISDISKEMSKHDVFLMTSAFEGLPISLIEATMSGLPCLVTDVGGCREIVDACQNGVAVSDLDPAKVSFEIEQLVNNKYLIEKFSCSSLEGSKSFSIETAAKQHLNMYSQYSR